MDATTKTQVGRLATVGSTFLATVAEMAVGLATWAEPATTHPVMPHRGPVIRLWLAKSLPGRGLAPF
jgi:hypothetical protein